MSDDRRRIADGQSAQRVGEVIHDQVPTLLHFNRLDLAEDSITPHPGQHPREPRCEVSVEQERVHDPRPALPEDRGQTQYNADIEAAATGAGLYFDSRLA